VQAVRETDAVGVTFPVPSGSLYATAFVYSLASAAAARDDRVAQAERTKRAEQYAARAVLLLAKAHRAGYFKYPGRLERLRKDPELGALRGRQDFQQLLALVEQRKE
jgi:hypothetical protein